MQKKHSEFVINAYKGYIVAVWKNEIIKEVSFFFAMYISIKALA